MARYELRMNVFISQPINGRSLARNTGEKRYVILYVLLHLDYNHKIFTTIYKDNILNKINNDDFIIIGQNVNIPNTYVW